MALLSISIKVNDFCRKYINPKIIDRINKAIADGYIDGEYSADAKEILIHKKTDSSIITWLKLALYYFEFNDLGNIVEPGVQLAKIYGMPLDTIQESVRFIPQIKIIFREKPIEAWEAKRRPRQAEMTIRVNNSLKESLSESKDNLLPIAETIVTLFKDITYQKGYEKYHYRDLDNNYKLSIFTSSQTEAETLITALLAINNDTPDFANHLIYPKVDKDYDSLKVGKVLGQSVTYPPERTKANMIFYRAELHWKGLEPIVLVNNSNRYHNAIIELMFL